MRFPHTIFGLAMLLAAEIPARAEYAVLRNGLRLHITGYEREGDGVRLHVAGGHIQVRAAEVTAIEPEERFPRLAERMPEEFPYASLIRAAAEKHGLEEELLASVIAAESGFDPRAVSPKGAQGLMQLMPATAARLEVRDAFDPAQNIEAGTRYLKELLGRYQGDLRLALAAYNAGPERVTQYKGIPPFAETRAYIRRVQREYADRKKAATS